MLFARTLSHNVSLLTTVITNDMTFTPLGPILGSSLSLILFLHKLNQGFLQVISGFIISWDSTMVTDSCHLFRFGYHPTLQGLS